MPMVGSPETPFYRRMKYTNGFYNSPEWDFQRESRFVIDFSVSTINKDMGANTEFDLLQLFNVSNLPFEYKDIKLSDYFFENLEITFGPKCSDVHKEFIQIYLNKHLRRLRLIDRLAARLL